MNDIINTIVQNKTLLIIVLSCIVLIVILLIILIAISGKSKKKEKVSIENTGDTINNETNVVEQPIIGNNTTEQIPTKLNTEITNEGSTEISTPQFDMPTQSVVNENNDVNSSVEFPTEPQNEINVGELPIPEPEIKEEPILENVNEYGLTESNTNEENNQIVSDTNNDLVTEEPYSLPIQEAKIEPIETTVSETNPNVVKEENTVITPENSIDESDNLAKEEENKMENIEIPKVFDTPLDSTENSDIETIQEKSEIPQDIDLPKVENENTNQNNDKDIFVPIEQIPIVEEEKKDTFDIGIDSVITDVPQEKIDNSDTLIPQEEVKTEEILENKEEEIIDYDIPSGTEEKEIDIKTEREKLLEDLNQQKKQEKDNQVNNEMFSALEDLKIK